MKTLKQQINESFNQVNENMKEWIFKDNNTEGTMPVQMYRFSGRTFPIIGYDTSQNLIIARNDNGNSASATLKFPPTAAGLDEAINAMSKPAPNSSTRKKFIDAMLKLV